MYKGLSPQPGILHRLDSTHAGHWSIAATQVTGKLSLGLSICNIQSTLEIFKNNLFTVH